MIREKKSENVPASLLKTQLYNGEDVKRQLMEDQHEKCYICERKLTTDFEIEHFKSQNKYPDLAREWSNLFLACGYCNRKKSDSFDNNVNPLTVNIEEDIIQRIDFDNNELEAVISIEGRKPERHHYSYMSDGLKAMINIVSEIAYRCIQLNGFLGKKSVEDTPGVVLIDEVDLYLHPKWQKHVLADLQKAFPKIQFIVSTHSPFIIQSLKENQLVSFDPDYQPGGQPYTEGLEDIASYRMGLSQKIRSSRFQEMTETAKKYFKALDDGDAKKEELREKLKRIEAEFSDNPAYLALIQLETQAKGGKI